ncbi:hypothetical protein WDW37_02155 [Bdellovibrionota bacterium FG-1]
MPQIQLRLQSGVSSSGDITLTVQDNTYDYLMTSRAPTIKVSAYLDQDWPQIEAKYADIFVHEACPSKFEVTKITPGSKIRKNLTLPGSMKNGEQLVIHVKRVGEGTSDPTS